MTESSRARWVFLWPFKPQQGIFRPRHRVEREEYERLRAVGALAALSVWDYLNADGLNQVGRSRS